MTTVSVVSAVAARIQCLLVRGQKASQDLSLELNELQKQFQHLRGLLADVDQKKIESRSIPELERKIITISYEIEDTVESYYLESESKGRGGFRSILRTSIRSVKGELESLRSMLSEIVTHLEKNGLSSRSRESLDASIHKHTPIIRQTSDNIKREDLLKMEEYIKQILVGHDKNDSVISVWGMGGMGKTTLAKKIYNHSEVRRAFQGFAWISISEELLAKDIFRAILLQLLPNEKKGILRMEDMELAQRLYKVQQEKKCLIVLDDIWTKDVWLSLRIAFPFGENDSRVLFTTREQQVAEDVASGKGRVYQMMPLSEKESWEIFKKVAGVDDQGLEEEMKIIGKEMVAICEGSPLAIIILAESLKTKDLADWEAMHNELKSYQSKFTFSGGMLEILSFIYAKLPLHLKPCFLYLGQFPEDQEIQAENLCLQWIAEGLILPEDGDSRALMDSAKDYLNKLAQRKMVDVEEEEIYSTFKYCRLHDLLRDLCISKGYEEEYFEIVDSGQGNGLRSSTQRVAVYLNKYQEGDAVPFIHHGRAKEIRFLLFFDTGNSSSRFVWPKEGCDLKEFRSLRVLHFEKVIFKCRKLPKGIEKLVYLRYLSLGGCSVDELPQSITHLLFLETLDLRVKASHKMTIPNVLWKLSRLRNLYFPLSYESDSNDKLKLDTLVQLEILENFNAMVCTAKDLLNLEKLKRLTTIAEGNPEDLKHIIESMRKNSNHLQHSSLDVRNFDCFSEERLSAFTNLLQVQDLYALHVEGHIGSLRQLDCISKNFIELVFNGSELDADPMPILGKLPNLKSLVLCNDAFVVKEVKCSESYFPVLRSLKLTNLHDVEAWLVEKGAMASLLTLSVERCIKLDVLPDGLRFITTLRELKIISMSKNFHDSVQKVYGEEGKDNGNQCVPTIVFEN